jgi:hypothetical protein
VDKINIRIADNTPPIPRKIRMLKINPKIRYPFLLNMPAIVKFFYMKKPIINGKIQANKSECIGPL